MNTDTLVHGNVPIILGQRWALTTKYGRYFPLLFALDAQVTAEHLMQTIQHLYRHHDMLRAKIRIQGSEFQQIILPDVDAIPFQSISFASLTLAERRNALLDVLATLYDSLDCYEGALIRCVHIDNGADQDLFLIVMHHLIYDAYSIALLLQDFQTVYQQVVQQKEPRLPAKTTSYKRFAEKLQEFARTHLAPDMKNWMNLPWSELVPLPVDYPEGLQLLLKDEQRAFVKISLGVEESAILAKEIPRTGNSLLHVLMAAYVLTLQQWLNTSLVAVGVADFGRMTFGMLLDDVDLAQTQGFISTNKRYLFSTSGLHEPLDILDVVREQMNRTAHGAVTCDVMHSMTDDASLKKWIEDTVFARMHFSLNFQGITHMRQGKRQSSPAYPLWGPATEYQDVDLGPWIRSHDLGIGGEWIDQQIMPTFHCTVENTDDQFQFTWDYSENLYKRSTIEDRAQYFDAMLRTLLEQLRG